MSSTPVAEIVEAIRSGDLTTRELVLISYALAARGNNTTSVLGQYGEELVGEAFDGKIGSFDQRGFDVLTSAGERLQVKTYTAGRKPGAIRSFAYDVITLKIDPATANVLLAKRYAAGDLFAAFHAKWESKYRHINDSFAGWAGTPEARYDRGWTIGSTVRFTDVTNQFEAAAAQSSNAETLSDLEAHPCS